MSEVFGIEVGNAAAGDGLLRRLMSAFWRNKYKFRVAEAPGLLAAQPWGQPSELGLTKSSLAYLPFQFPGPSELQMIGQELALTVFNVNHGQIIRLFHNSLAAAGRRNEPLRVMFSYHQDSDELVRTLPWESLFYPIMNEQPEHFGLSRAIGVARFLPPHFDGYLPLQITDELRVLAVAPNPKNCATELEVTAELTLISQIANSHKEEIVLMTPEQPQWKMFDDGLVKHDPHIMFFAGHGGFVNNQPFLFFEKADQDCEPVSVKKLASSLRQVPSLRLVILSACQTAVPRQLFVSAAEELIRSGVPAVIAMQSKVDDAAAREFSLRFFNYFFQQKYSIDICVNAGREAMHDIRRNETEWAVPVLYLSTRNDIFDFSISAKIRAADALKRSSMEEKFPLTVEPFIPRTSLRDEFNLESNGSSLTAITGPFGSGKTWIIADFCTEMIRNRAPFLFFYIECREDWQSFAEVLDELDFQARNLEFSGFKAILSDVPRFGPANSIRAFSELLASQNLVIVFDDYVWDGPTFWRELFNYLGEHLRRSRVFVITSADRAFDLRFCKRVEVKGFTANEARQFFQTAPGNEPGLPDEVVAEMMTLAEQLGYLPWYVQIIKEVFQRGVGHQVEGGPRLLEFIARIDKTLSETEKEVLHQLSVLRKPVTLQALAMMLRPESPAAYLEAAYKLQNMSLLTFTRNLGVELPREVRQHYSNIDEADRRLFHARAAGYYERRADAIMREEQPIDDAQFADGK